MKNALAISLIACMPLVCVAQGRRGFGGGPGLGGRGGVEVFSRTTVTGAPFSATETMTAHQTLANGNQISQTEQVKLYRDAQGRTRVERTVTPPAAANQQPFTEIVITDPVAGYRYVLDSATMTAAQMPLPPARTPNPNAAAGRGANASDAVTTSLGTQTINGVLSTGTQITRTIPAGQIGNAQPIQLVRITWISNDLKIPVEVKTSDPRSGTTDLEVTNIVQSAPDASLFSVPSTYTIKTGGPGGRGPGGRPNGNFRRP